MPRLTVDRSGAVLTAAGRVIARVTVSVEAPRQLPLAVPGWRRVRGGMVGRLGTLRCTLTASPAAGGLVVSATLANEGPHVVGLRRFRFAALPMPGLWTAAQGALCGLKIGYCGAHSRSHHSRSAVVELRLERPERGWWVGALAPRRGGPGIVLGSVDFRRFVTAVELGPGIDAVEFLEGWPLEPGESLDLAQVWLAVSDDAPLAALESYAAEVGRRHAVTPRAAPCGWGSWGHFLESIDADLMRENLLALDGLSGLSKVMRVVQIDDGWSELLETERASASWRPNRRFPSGIAPLADAVRRRNRECGLWMLPFTVNAGSPLAEAHPEYLVQDAGRQPMRVGGGTSYCLDPSHPGAAGWITDLLGRFQDWGVRYVKIDHLRALLMPDPDVAVDDLDVPRVHRERVTRVEAYRRGLALIRQAVGPDTFIVGCSAPAGPGVGLVDAHRVGPDIEPAWQGTVSGMRDAARALAANFFWQGRTWVNDPDYLLAGASVDESRFWATAVALSGGSAIVSADLGELPQWQEALFAAVTPPTGRAARPLDLFEHGPEPRVWHLAPSATDDPWHVLGLFNWDERPVQLALDLAVLSLTGPVHIWDVWRGRHRVARHLGAVSVAAHSAALLTLRAVDDRPQVVGTDAHFAPGSCVIAGERWHARARTLQLAISRSLPRAGQAYVWVPAGLRCEDGALPVPDRADLVRIALEPGAVCSVRFSASR